LNARLEENMRKTVLAAMAISAALSGAQGASAKGHLVGGAIGAAAAGKHHRVAGAVVGGAIGHHMAKKADAKKAAQGH
jgi:hypothetical protein